MTTAANPKAARHSRRRSAPLRALLVTVLAASLICAPAVSATAAPAPAAATAQTFIGPAALKLARIQMKKIRTALAGTTPTLAKVTMKTGFDAKLLVKINRARTERGIAPVKLARKMVTVADHWTGQMVSGRTGYALAHNSNLAAMTRAVRPRSTTWGENVAQFTEGSHSARAIFNLYMSSPSHRANILSPKFRVVGLSSACIPSGQRASTCFNTMDFSR